jgi:hypothetical protein
MVQEKLFRLARLADTPADKISDFIRSAFDGDKKIDLAHIAKHNDAYVTFLLTAYYAVVVDCVRKDTDLASLARELRKSLTSKIAGQEIDLGAYLESTQFHTEQDSKPDSDASDSDSDTLTDDSDEAALSPADAYEIRHYVDLVMRAYNELYGTVFDPIRPKGAYSADRALGPNGVIKHHTSKDKGGAEGNDSVISPSSVALNRVAALHEALLGGATLIETSKLSAAELGARGGYYFSTLAGRFASGAVKSPGKRFRARDEFARAQRAWVERKLASVYREYADRGEDAVRQALEVAAGNLMTAFVVAEFDPDVACLLVLKVCVPGVSLMSDKGGLQRALSAKHFGSIEIRDIHDSRRNESDKTDFLVYTIAVALDSDRERLAPMYAYQVWDGIAATGDITQAIGTHNVVFGRRQDGSMQTFNMARMGASPEHNITVVAKSGSGKGLTTMATLASAVVHGEPIFYLDCKPDMSLMLWACAEAAGQPGRVFSYDAIGGYGKMRTPIQGSDAARYKHYQFPYSFDGIDGASGGSDTFAGLVFSKALSLLFAMMSFSNINEPDRQSALGYDLRNGALIVFDELGRSAEKWDQLQNLCESKAAREKSGGQLTPRARYVIKLQDFYQNIRREVDVANTALLRISPFSTLSLFQKIGLATGGTSKVSGIFGNFSLVGLMDEDGARADLLKGRSQTTIAALKARQWYVYPHSIKGIDTSKLTKPVKPFLLFDTPAKVDDYLSSDATFAELPESFKEEVRQNKHKMDFAGLLNAHGVNLATSLAKGYDMAQEFLRLAGFPGTVDDYILSAQEDTLITVSELCSRAIAGFTGRSPVVPVDTIPDNSDVDEFDDFESGFSDEVETSGATNPSPHATQGANVEPASYTPSQAGFSDSLNDADFESFPEMPEFSAAPKRRQIFRYEGKQFYADEDGNLIPVDGRYAPPADYERGVFNGRRYTSQPVVESTGDSFNVGVGGAVRLGDDTSRYAAHGQVLDGTETVVGSMRSRVRITASMSPRKLEKELAQQWRALLKLAQAQVNGAVVRVSIGENFFSVNDKPVYIENIGGDSGLRVIDIVDFADMFNLYRGLTTLRLDVVAKVRFSMAYSHPYVPFTKHPKLEIIYFMSDNNQMLAYDRNTAARQAGLPVDRLTSRVNTWSECVAQVNRGSTSALCKPGNRLMMADFTKRMAAGTFGADRHWSKPRRALGFIGMLFGASATVVTGGVQMARSIRRRQRG